jgi:hypothetical protein
MKKIMFIVSFVSITIFAFANYRSTGSFVTSCGTTWNYVIHPSDTADHIHRLANILIAAERACDSGETVIYS